MLIRVSKWINLNSFLRLEFKIIWVAIAGPINGGGSFPKINMVGFLVFKAYGEVMSDE